MKISRLEKIVLGCTAAFLLLSAGYYWGVRSSADPYRVDVERAAAAYEEQAPQPVPDLYAESGAEKLDLNTATAEELQRLPGIGEQRARDIVADREANGPFRIVEDVTRVGGIGEWTLAGILDLVTAE